MSIEIGTVNHFGIDSKKVQEFYRANWNRPIALADDDFYTWQFKSAPTQKNLDTCVLCYDSKNREILGVMGVNNRTFIINGESKSGAEMTTWIISKALQGSGIGTKIISHIQSDYEVVSGFGISDVALRVYMRQNFRFIRQIPRFVKVINFEPLKKYAKYNSLAQDLIDRWATINTSRFTVCDLNEVSLGSANDYLIRNFNHFSRDYAHLQWRYENHPYFHHKQFMISSVPQNVHAPVFVCLREELSVADFKILHVLDCFGTDENMSATIAFIEAYASENNFDVIDFYCTAASINCHFINSGWFSTSDDICFQFPNLFHPIEMRDPPTANVVYWSKSDFAKLADLSNLYITKQDSDLDRPTPENMLKNKS